MSAAHRRLTSVAALATVVFFHAGPAARVQQPDPQIFRATADLVAVEVSVRSNGVAVTGLGPADFVLLDNGVRQKIARVDVQDGPLDVSILIDLSDDLEHYVSRMRDDITRIAARLRPSDRLRVMAINTDVVELAPAQSPETFPALGRLVARGLSSAHDGLAAALLRPVAPNRRHLIVALTNGIDAVSTLEAGAVRDIALRSPATLHIAQVDMAIEIQPSETPSRIPPRWLSSREWENELRCRNMMICSPTRQFWRPYNRRAFDVLADAAASTGGALHQPGAFVDRTGSAIFAGVYEEFRQTYLLHYAPTGVARSGAHTIDVTIPGHPDYRIRGRRGYVVDPADRAPGEAVVAGSRSSVSSSSGPARAIDEIAAAYGRADYAAFIGHLRQVRNHADLMRDLRSRGNPWPDRPSREAAFVLEVADFGLQSPRPDDREAARRLLRAHLPLVRHPIEPDPFERLWTWAAVVVLGGSNEPAPSRAFVDEALTRFPNEARLLLARALWTDKRQPLGTFGGVPEQPLSTASAAHVREVADLYDAAMAFEETAIEARVRKGWLFHRAGRHDDALAVLEAAGDSALDPFVGYLRHLFRGRVLAALGRADDAIAAYGAAVAFAPSAQSAKVGLMSTLLARGDADGAQAEAEAIQRLPAAAWDPWWRYWHGDYRRLPDVLARLRELTR